MDTLQHDDTQQFLYAACLARYGAHLFHDDNPKVKVHLYCRICGMPWEEARDIGITYQPPYLQRRRLLSWWTGQDMSRWKTILRHRATHNAGQYDPSKFELY